LESIYKRCLARELEPPMHFFSTTKPEQASLQQKKIKAIPARRDNSCLMPFDLKIRDGRPSRPAYRLFPADPRRDAVWCLSGKEARIDDCRSRERTRTWGDFR
jgi:hypothetical protein